jgi:hypothetical protein
VLDVLTVQCPWCFEEIEISIDPETEGAFVQDCEVCCRPWALTLKRDVDGDPVLDVQRAD